MLYPRILVGLKLTSLRFMLRETLLTILAKISNSTLLPLLILFYLSLLPPVIISCNYPFVVYFLSLECKLHKAKAEIFFSLSALRAYNMLGYRRLSINYLWRNEWVMSWANEEVCRILRKLACWYLRIITLAGEFGHLLVAWMPSPEQPTHLVMTIGNTCS